MSSRRSKRMSATSEDSTEDLISKDPPRPSVDSTINDGAYMNYVVEVPRTEPYKRWHRFINKSLIVSAVILLLVALVFICLYFHERSFRSELQTQKSICPKQKETKRIFCTTSSCVEAAAYMQAAMDKSINPCDDFYLYSCAGWLSNNPIPDGESMWSSSSVLTKKNDRILKDILENTTVHSAKDVDSVAEYNAYKLYRSCRNMKEINKLGIRPLVELMHKAGGFVKKGNGSAYENLDIFLNEFYKSTLILPIFGVSVGRDDKNSNSNIIKVSQRGIGLSQYIFKANTTDNKKIIAAYIAYNVQLGLTIEKTFNKEDFEDIAVETFDFERKLQKIFVPHEKLTTIDEYYHKTSLGKFQNMFKKIQWKDLLQQMFDSLNIQIKDDEPLLVYTMSYFEKLDDLLKNTDLRVVQNLAMFQLLRHSSSFLTEDVISLRKNLSIAERGTYKQLERWKRCVKSTDSSIGMASGALFVKRAFATDSIEIAHEMVKDVRKSFIQGFETLTWMDEETRAAAKDKADAIIQKIGYPNYIVDPKQLDKHYKGMDFNDKQYFQNIQNASKWYVAHHLKKLHEPVQKTDWDMSPPTVNAYYDPSENEIVFPAGILQPPYFKYDYPKSVNYGMMGAVIGHEITHAFDNNGRLYDKDGNYGKSWWTLKAAKIFEEKSKCFVSEYSNFTDVRAPSLHIKGNVTLGENIADNGGLKAAYRAYQNYVKENGEEQLLPGVAVTNEQAFFISFAQSWCTDELTQMLINAINTDSHSPAIERVRGSVQNNKDFARAFKCSVGSQMNPKHKCSIWS